MCTYHTLHPSADTSSVPGWAVVHAAVDVGRRRLFLSVFVFSGSIPRSGGAGSQRAGVSCCSPQPHQLTFPPTVQEAPCSPRPRPRQSVLVFSMTAVLTGVGRHLPAASTGISRTVGAVEPPFECLLAVWMSFRFSENVQILCPSFN